MEDGRRRTTSFIDGIPPDGAQAPPVPHPLQDALHGMAISDDESDVGGMADVNTVRATPVRPAGGPDSEISYGNVQLIGSGSFGVVFKVRLIQPGGVSEVVALKKVVQDKRYKNRELEIMRALQHPNVSELRWFFYSVAANGEVYLHLIMQYLPQTLHEFATSHHRAMRLVPIFYVRLFGYQLLRGLGYLHAKGICHRDIKPHNVLVDPQSGILRLCDFGSAKVIEAGKKNVAYICSRYYRAPELIFGAEYYTNAIDLWSAGCVIGELSIGRPLFQGDTSVDQLVVIIKVLGSPSHAQIAAMNPCYTDQPFPCVRPCTLQGLFEARPPRERSAIVALASAVLCYDPRERMQALALCAEPFFDELRDPRCALPDGRPLPPLCNFTPRELSTVPSDVVPRLARRTHPSAGLASATADTESDDDSVHGDD